MSERSYMIPVAEKLPVTVGSKVVYRAAVSAWPWRIYVGETGTVVRIHDIGLGPVFFLLMDGHAKPRKGYHVAASKQDILAVRES